MSKLGKDLIKGMSEAAAYAAGNVATARAHIIEVPDVRAIRRQLQMSQNEFAAAFRIPLATIKNWEQRRRAPDAPAAAYLVAIARQPEVIREALRHD